MLRTPRRQMVLTVTRIAPAPPASFRIDATKGLAAPFRLVRRVFSRHFLGFSMRRPRSKIVIAGIRFRLRRFRNVLPNYATNAPE